MVFLIVSIVFILLGFLFMKYPPEGKNSMCGYRTPMSMKNQDTWNVSQKHSGFSMIILGIVNGVLAIWSIIQPFAINMRTVQLLFLLIGAIVLIAIEEINLRKIFNEDGSRKK